VLRCPVSVWCHPIPERAKTLARKRYHIRDNPEGVTPSRLKRLGRATQLEYMEEWFREYYEDPVNEMPRDDGQFAYPWGGPYDAFDELWEEFGGLVPEDRIQDLAKKLQTECIEWAPTSQKQRELGEADEALAFPMWPSEPRAIGEGAARDAGILEEAEAKDEVTAEYVPPRMMPVSATMAQGSSLTVQATVKRAPTEASEPDAGILAASAEQRPAAYRFGVRDGKIDVLPEPPEPEDREFALDTYQELVAKARELHERLKATNSARRVCNSVERLLAALGAKFDDLRPGVLLSRERSMAADRAAFEDDDARGELFPRRHRDDGRYAAKPARFACSVSDRAAHRSRAACA
jgi:hypothetical protein